MTDWLDGQERLPNRFVPGARIRVIADNPDDGWVAIEKPAGLLSIPGRGPERADCVEAQVRELFPTAEVAQAVHRLDLETSGVMLVATRRAGVVRLTRWFEERRVEKTYEAVVAARPAGPGGWIDLPIAASTRPRYAIAVGGRPARTRWTWLHRAAEGEVLRLYPETGRTHQLRLHCAYPVDGAAGNGLGTPILGDSLYGDPNSAPRLMLHAIELVLPTGDRLNAPSPVGFSPVAEPPPRDPAPAGWAWWGR